MDERGKRAGAFSSPELTKLRLLATKHASEVLHAMFSGGELHQSRTETSGAGPHTDRERVLPALQWHANKHNISIDLHPDDIAWDTIAATMSAALDEHKRVHQQLAGQITQLEQTVARELLEQRIFTLKQISEVLHNFLLTGLDPAIVKPADQVDVSDGKPRLVTSEGRLFIKEQGPLKSGTLNILRSRVREPDMLLTVEEHLAKHHANKKTNGYTFKNDLYPCLERLKRAKSLELDVNSPELTKFGQSVLESITFMTAAVSASASGGDMDEAVVGDEVNVAYSDATNPNVEETEQEEPVASSSTTTNASA